MNENKYYLPLGRSLNFELDNYVEELKKAENLGFYSIDFDLCNFWRSPAEVEREKYEMIEERLDLLKATKLVLNGVHISFGPRWDPSAVDEKEREENCARIREIFKRIDPYKPRCYVLHGSSHPFDPDRKGNLAVLKESVLALSEHTDGVICLETQPRRGSLYSSEEACEVADWFAERTEKVKICIDVNHILEEKSEDVVLRLGKHIFTTHISDHDYIDEKHWLPGKGKIDWMKLLESFEKIGYKGVFNYEVWAESADMKANYDAMFGWYNEIRVKKSSP